MRNRVILSCLLAAALLRAGKQFQPGEADSYNKVIEEINSGKFVDAIGDIEIWQQKIPASEYSSERAALYIQASAGANRPTQALDAAAPLLEKDLDATFEGAAGQAMQIRLLYNAVWAIGQIPNPTPAQISTAEKAAHKLMEYDTPLPGVNEAKWAEARADMKQKADDALFYIAMLPGVRAMAGQPPDCKSATSAYRKAMAQWPSKASIAWETARAIACEAREDPARYPLALYYFQRAATLDPTLGNPRNDPAKITSFADSAYIKFHGERSGLDELRTLAKQSASPASNFTIQSASDVAVANRKQFQEEHPQIALWMQIRERLSAPDGPAYFESELKGAAVPRLLGAVTAATPACRARELKIAVSAGPEQAKPEITLQLDKPLTGRPELQQEIQWEGIAETFVPAPFMLTMRAQSSSITGLKMSACTTAGTVRRKQ